MIPKQYLLWLLFFSLQLMSCSSMQVTPIVKSPTGEHIPGKFVWYDLLTDDMERSKRFYAGLFAWQFNTIEGYTEIINDSIPIAGIVEINTLFNKAKPSRWLPSLSVEDVKVATEISYENGAKIIDGPGELGQRGKFVLIEDSIGAKLILLNSKSGDPVDRPVAIGAWLWNELWTDEPDKSQLFYQQLVGYRDQNLVSGYKVLSKDNVWRSGIRSVFLKGPGPMWVPTIRVKSTALTASLAKQLGGEVLVRMDPVNEKRDVALIRDPNGALFMVQSWADQDKVQEH